MAKSKSSTPERDMSAHIPEGQEMAENVERDTTAKTNDLGDGLHQTSKTFGTVVSDYATDAAGLTPEEMAARASTHMGHGEEDDKK